MNNDRRKRIDKLVTELDDLVTEEQEAYDNMPEGLQESERGQTMQKNIAELDEAKDLLEIILQSQ